MNSEHDYLIFKLKVLFPPVHPSGDCSGGAFFVPVEPSRHRRKGLMTSADVM